MFEFEEVVLGIIAGVYSVLVMVIIVPFIADTLIEPFIIDIMEDQQILIFGAKTVSAIVIFAITALVGKIFDIDAVTSVFGPWAFVTALVILAFIGWDAFSQNTMEFVIGLVAGKCISIIFRREDIEIPVLSITVFVAYFLFLIYVASQTPFNETSIETISDLISQFWLLLCPVPIAVYLAFCNDENLTGLFMSILFCILGVAYLVNEAMTGPSSWYDYVIIVFPIITAIVVFFESASVTDSY